MKEILGGLLVILVLGGTLAELMQLVAKATASEGVDKLFVGLGVSSAAIMFAIWETSKEK